MDTRTKTVVVIGHGRSGTSMVAGILNILRVNMDFVHNPNKGNPRGDFESPEIVRINDAILREANKGKDYFLEIPESEDVMLTGGKYKGDIQEYVKGKSGLWGFKDPRTSLTLSLYLPHLENLHIVHVSRKEEDVTASQFASSGDRYSKSDILKNLHEYEKRIQEFKTVSDVPWIDISFESVLENPAREAERLAKFVGLEVKQDILSDIENFVIPRENIKQERNKASVVEFFRKVAKRIWNK